MLTHIKTKLKSLTSPTQCIRCVRVLADMFPRWPEGAVSLPDFLCKELPCLTLDPLFVHSHSSPHPLCHPPTVTLASARREAADGDWLIISLNCRSVNIFKGVAMWDRTLRQKLSTGFIKPAGSVCVTFKPISLFLFSYIMVLNAQGQSSRGCLQPPITSPLYSCADQLLINHKCQWEINWMQIYLILYGEVLMWTTIRLTHFIINRMSSF